MVEGPVRHLINFHVVKRCALWDIGNPFRTKTIEPNQLLSLSVKSSQIETVTEGVELGSENILSVAIVRLKYLRHILELVSGPNAH
jgi:hypothetical protein